MYMEAKNINKFISVSYKLSSREGDKINFEEEATEDMPFSFITGFGYSLEEFENQMLPLSKGDTFNFELTPEQGYGEYLDALVQDINKEIFCIDGKFDDKNIYLGAIVPLQNAEGQRFFGQVLDITDSIVKMNLNHPLAGKGLIFEGKILESREATPEEITALLSQMSGHGSCSGGCGGCGGNCGDNCGDGGCGGNCGCGK